jgi:hypothetical protein
MIERKRHAFNQRQKSCSSEGLSTPSGILDNVPDDLRRKLPDDVVDELLAAESTTQDGRHVKSRHGEKCAWARSPAACRPTRRPLRRATKEKFGGAARSLPVRECLGVRHS